MASPRLTTTKYVKNRAYVGDIINPGSGAISGIPRIPCYIGRGSRLAYVRNSEITRSYVYEEDLVFVNNGGYKATLQYESDGDYSVAILKTGSGVEIPQSKWTLLESNPGVSGYDTILIQNDAYDTNEDYKLSYQSVDRSVLDPLPIDDLRKVVKLSVNVDDDLYQEYVDFRVPVTYGTELRDYTGSDADVDVFGAEDAINTNGAPGQTALLKTVDAESETFTTGVDFSVDNVTGDVTGVPNATYVTLSTAADAIVYVIKEGDALTSYDYTHTAGSVILIIDDGDPGFNVTVVYQVEQAASATFNGADAIPVTPAGYTGKYNRKYVLTCTSATGTHPNRVLRFSWVATPINGTPLSASAVVPSPEFSTDDANTITVDQSDLSSYELDNDLTLTFAADAAFYSDTHQGAVFVVYGLGPAMLHIDARHRNTNQFLTYGTITEDAGNTGTGVVSYAGTNSYTGTHNRKYRLKVSAAGAASTTFLWYGIGELESTGVYSTGTVTIADGASGLLELGVRISPDTAANFDVGDKFTFEVKVPRRDYFGKDDRTYDFTVTSAANASVVLPGRLAASWNTNTYEGSFGSLVNTTVTGATPHVSLPDNLVVVFRNLGIYESDISYSVANRFAADDQFRFSITLDDVFDFSLNKQETETVATVYADSLGIITGTAGAYYLLLKYTPVAGSTLTISNITSGASVTGTVVTDSSGDPTPYVQLSADPLADGDEGLSVVYTHKGKEPAPGQKYFLTATYLRPASMYNTPQRLVGREDALSYLGPSEKDNHLYVMADAAFTEFPTLQAIYVIQVQDTDQDGLYTRLDYETAIPEAQLKEDISDIVVLSGFDSLGTQISHVNAMNNPFVGKFRILWVGMPTDSVIGDPNTADSLVYTAKKTLQVYGNAQYHGTRVLVAPTYVKKTIKLFNGTNYEFTGDGSFFAGTLAAMNASFDVPWETLLNKQSTYWDEVQTYKDSEDLILGAAGIIFAEQVATSIYRIGESTTVDMTSGTAYAEISGMNQVQYMKRLVSQQLTEELVGYVPESTNAAIAAVRSVLVSVLNQAVSQQLIGNYQDSDGAPRKLNPVTDIEVVADDRNKTLFYFMYSFFGRYPIKKLFGLQMVDSSTFFTGTAG